ncbi:MULTISPECIES: hypothetical protein [Aequorivita]|uniref:Uncharacterized protein n=1 Tax=Aequorivita iocasae TaxID=2803865 RepID=A0ABX7DP61_9FLAO|nr:MULTISPECIES: hypothetical protein [Aequorivita]QQX75920.1 hypothetical protein JK629_11330 [Aequorivita iocasae]UCA55382.1 hypothetical protein LDL78_11385 [Aequorivita sp. F7]
MRNIFSLLISILISIGIYAQDVNDNVRYIPESQVPPPVLDRQGELFPTNFVSEWQVQEMDGMQDAQNIRYIAKFEEDGRPGFSASYLPNGILIFNSEFMPSEIIPAKVRLKVEGDYKDYTIRHADFITFYNPKREIYMIKLLDDINVRYAFYNTAGNKIPKDSLPQEIVLLMN